MKESAIRVSGRGRGHLRRRRTFIIRESGPTPHSRERVRSQRNANPRISTLLSAMVAFEDEYTQELIATARYITTLGKGILAANESTWTIGKRLASIHVENVESNKQDL
ncbi:hypothetical protein L7F22_041605 [Adiantum nelumboides]|nr:hypothetical protein [Adiantum nelumboides]